MVIKLRDCAVHLRRTTKFVYQVENFQRMAYNILNERAKS